MTNAVSRRKSKGQTADSGSLAPAGRHMNQPAFKTISAARVSMPGKTVDLVDVWRQSDPLDNVEASWSRSSIADHGPGNVTNRKDDSTDKRSTSSNSREHQLRYKKLVALACVVAVCLTISILTIALIASH